MPRRRRQSSSKTYSLREFLEKQPKTLRRYEGYSALNEYLSNGPLNGVRISSRCYRVLNKAVLTEKNLDDFYRTYRLKPHPFYPLYLTMKQKYLTHRREIEEKKQQYILKAMKLLPPEPRQFLRNLAELEKKLHPGGDYPVWSANLYPQTKKRCDQFLQNDEMQWLAVFRDFFRSLEKRYRNFTKNTGERYLAAYVLRLPMESVSKRPSVDEVKNAYRKASKKHHPDNGGDAELFLYLQWARDQFLVSQKRF